MKGDKKQIAIIIVGILCYGVAVRTMLFTPTLIMSPLYLVLIYTPFLFGAAFGLGALIRSIAGSRWKTVTFAMIIISAVTITYSVLAFTPTYKIIVPEKFAGEVHLILSTEKKNDFELNNFGIGYVNEKTLGNGFRPKVIQDGKNITESITGYGTGSSSFSDAKGSGSIDFFSFQVPGETTGLQCCNIDDLIEKNAIDIKKIKRR